MAILYNLNSNYHCCHYRGFDYLSYRPVFVAVIRAANSRGTSFGISLFFSSLLSSGWPADLDRGGGQRDWGWYFFLYPARFSRPLRNIARQLYQTRPNCDISPPSPPRCRPASRGFCHAPSSLFFYSRFPVTYARRFFFIACASNLFGWSFFRELAIKIVIPTNRVHRTRFVRSIAWRDSWIMSGRENDGK